MDKRIADLERRYQYNGIKLINGDALTVLKTLPSESVHCCVTSPPYWGLRDYGVEGQLGLEKTPEEYVAKMVEIFGEVRRVLREDGTLWLNLGDSYAGSNQGHGTKELSAKQSSNTGTQWMTGKVLPRLPNNLKAKDLIGIPWRCAFALQQDGWYLRSDIIWAKPNPMPESVKDRPTKSHEYVFLLSKNARYYFDQDAVKEPFQGKDERQWQGCYEKDGSIIQGSTNAGIKRTKRYPKEYGGGGTSFKGHSGYYKEDGTPIGNGFRNIRSVWTIATQPQPEAHFATFPEALVIKCILAGCPEKGIVLDPFAGTNTTGRVAKKLNRKFIAIELNPAYIEIAERVYEKDVGLLI